MFLRLNIGKSEARRMELVRTVEKISKGDSLVEGLVFYNLKSKAIGKLTTRCSGLEAHF